MTTVTSPISARLPLRFITSDFRGKRHQPPGGRRWRRPRFYFHSIATLFIRKLPFVIVRGWKPFSCFNEFTNEGNWHQNISFETGGFEEASWQLKLQLFTAPFVRASGRNCSFKFRPTLQIVLLLVGAHAKLPFYWLAIEVHSTCAYNFHSEIEVSSSG